MQIKVNENYYIEKDERFHTLTPFYFRAGGEVVRGIGGKETEQKDKWISSGQYFNTLPAALKWIVDHSLVSGGDLTLDEYVREYRRAVEELKWVVR